MRIIISALAAIIVLFSAALAKNTAPLFASDEPVKIKIIGPLKELIRKAPKSTDPYLATLQVVGAADDVHAIELSARGNSRRDRRTCRFPPLRVRFDEKPGKESAFKGEKSLKLVTHCRAAARYQQYYLREFAAYKLLNLMTPVSLKVRQAEIEYIDGESQEVIEKRYGFFIEDIDDAAKRNDMKEIGVDEIGFYDLNQEAGAIYGLFQYMIGNLDWSVQSGMEGSDCCHNTKLVGETKESLKNLFPVPYDFDYSGFVDAPYALPPEGLPVRSVRNRYYRGFCIHNDEVRLLAAQVLQNKAAMFAVFDGVVGLDDKNRRAAEGYLEEFFEELGDPGKLDKMLVSRCRT